MRLVESLFRIGYTGHVILLNWVLIGKYQAEMRMERCPNHVKSPYAFKYWAFEYARKKGYDNVLWLDASFWAIRSLQNLFDKIDTIGYVLQRSDGYKLGNWCSDFALDEFDLLREKALSMTMHDGGFIGLNMHDAVALAFLRRMLAYSLERKLFLGAWTNKRHEVSHDNRVLGHRHDMSIGTIVATQLKMKVVPKGTYWIQKEQHKNYPNVCLLGQGM